LSRPPEEVANINSYDIEFLKAGILWEFELVGKIGRSPFMF
jgi:hypothetical protein